MFTGLNLYKKLCKFNAYRQNAVHAAVVTVLIAPVLFARLFDDPAIHAVIENLDGRVKACRTETAELG